MAPLVRVGRPRVGYAPVMDALDLLAHVVAQGGSDLHLVACAAPSMRLHGEIKPLSHPPLDKPTCDELVRSLLQHHQLEALERDWQISVSRELEDAKTGRILGHFRVSVHLRDGVAEAAIRVTPRRIRTPDELGGAKHGRAVEQGLDFAGLGVLDTLVQEADHRLGH